MHDIELEHLHMEHQKLLRAVEGMQEEMSKQKHVTGKHKKVIRYPQAWKLTIAGEEQLLSYLQNAIANIMSQKFEVCNLKDRLRCPPSQNQQLNSPDWSQSHQVVNQA